VKAQGGARDPGAETHDIIPDGCLWVCGLTLAVCASFRWSKPVSCESEARVWHSATLLPGKNMIVVFGKRFRVPDPCQSSQGVFSWSMDLGFAPSSECW
jgi:hypothetical protein